MRDPIWRHLAALVAAAGVLALALQATTWHGRLPSAGWGLALLAGWYTLAQPLYALLPMVAGIAAGTSRLAERGASGLRSALVALGMVLAGMVVLNLWLEPAASRAETVAAQAYGARWPGLAPRPGVDPLAEESELRVVARLLTGGLPGVSATAPTYPPGHPRVAAAHAIPVAGLLLSPFILMGVVLGVAAWVRRRVSFRVPRDELVARWVMAWVLVPAGLALIAGLTTNSMYPILFRRAPLWQPLIGYLPLLLIGALGWRSAFHAEATSGAAGAPGTVGSSPGERPA